MAIQAQISDQVSGQLSGLTLENGSSLASQTSNQGDLQRSWHTDIDNIAVRRYIIDRILQVFQRRTITREWQQRLPDFVKRLEEILFKEAASKEEYMDLSTLESRMQVIVMRFQQLNNRNQNLGHHNPITHLPTPGNDISTASGPGTGNVVPNTMGNMLPSSNDSASIMQ